MSGLHELLEQNSTDPRTRLELGQQILQILERSHLPSDSILLAAFCDLLVQWLNGSNFKVALLALEILDAALDISGDVLTPYLLDNTTTLMERLGDSKEQVRQTTLDILLKLMAVPLCSPQMVFEKLLAGFTHKQWLVRVGVMQVLQNTLRTYGGNSLQLSKVVPLICKLITDPNIQVRDTTADTLVEIYVFTGDRFVADLQKRRLIPDNKLSSLRQRFDDAKRSGLVNTDGEPMAAAGNDRVLNTNVNKTPRQQRIGATSTGRMRRDETDERENCGSVNKMAAAWSNSRASSVPAHKRVNVTAKYGGRKSGSYRVNRVGSSGSAGTVNDDQFQKAFTEVTEVEVYSGKDLIAQTEKIRVILEDSNSDWNKRVDGLRKLRSILIGGAANHQEEFMNELRLLEVPLQMSVKDLRSQVVREACITIAFYSERLESKMDHLAPTLFHGLISLVQNSAKVMATSGILACRYIIRHVRTPKLIPIITSHSNSKSREIRRNVCDMVAQIISSWEPHVVERNMAAILETIRLGLNDADPEARAASRKAYHILAENFKEQADQLYQNLGPSKQRQIAGEISQSSSTHSIGGVQKSQENINVRSSGYGIQRNAYCGNRSTSDIDTGAVRRAMQRHIPPSSRVKVPLQPMNSLQRPQRLTTPHRAMPPNTMRTPDTNGRLTSRIASKSISQPGSRSGSPTTRLPGGVRKNRPISGRSREQSPQRIANSTTPYNRRLSTENSRNVTPNKDMERAILDALKLRSGGYLDDFDDGASQSSDRSLNRLESAELNDAIRTCQSTQWADKKEGLITLQAMFKQQKPLGSIELKRLCDCFTRMFVDQNNKAFCLFLDTLVDFLAAYRADLCDWLYVLLTRLLTKCGSDLLQSIQTKLQKTLQVVRESFTYEMQFHTLCKYLQDPVHTPSIKVKVALLHYLRDLIDRMDSPTLENTSEIRQAVSKIILWVNEPKSAEVRKASQEVLFALFSLNAGEFSSILGTYPKQSQDTVYALLKQNMKRQGLTASSPAPKAQHSYSGDMLQVHDRLRETSAQINQYVFGADGEKVKGGSQDSGIVDAVDSGAFSRVDENSRLMENFCLNGDEERQQEIVVDICQELSNHNKRSAERLKSMNALRNIVRDGSFSLWNEHFKTILLLMIETLGDRDFDVRAHALRVLKDICQHEAPRFRDYAELTLMRVLDAHKDSEKEVVRNAEECAAMLATHLPPHICLRVLNSIIGREGMPKLLAAIKMLIKVVEKLNPDEIERILPDTVPGVIKAYENTDSSVRKGSVLCLVAFNNALGEEPLQDYLSVLNNSKIKLLQLYIKRGQTASGNI